MKFLYTCDDNYVWLMGVSLISLFENNRHMPELEVYLLGEHVCDDNKQKLYSIGERYHRQIHILDVEPDQYIPASIALTRWPLSAYTRLFAAELLPTSIEEILYLDCDTVIEGKIEEFKNDHKHIFWGVKDCVGKYYKENIGLKKDAVYVNAGVLFMDLNELRKINITKSIESFWQKYGKRITYADQDVLNGMFAGKISFLPLKYNVMTIVARYSMQDICKLRRPCNFYLKNEVAEAVRSPHIIHYTTNMRTIRPWYGDSDHPYAALFRKYLAMSPWAERELKISNLHTLEGKEIEYIEKLPKELSYPLLGFVHAVLRPLLVRFKSFVS